MWDPAWVRDYRGLRLLRSYWGCLVLGVVALAVFPLGILQEDSSADQKWTGVSGAIFTAFWFFTLGIAAWLYVACIERALALGAGPIEPVVGERAVKRELERLVWFTSRRWIYRSFVGAAAALLAAGLGSMAYLINQGTDEMVAVCTGLALVFASAHAMTIALLHGFAVAIVGRLDDLARELER